MKRFPPLRISHIPVAAILVLGLSCWSSAALAQSTATQAAAQPASSPDDAIRLTDEQRSAILNSNTVESAAAARGELTGADRAALGIHGEVGVEVGSNGSRAVYGAAAIPLGDRAGAVVSFESSQYGYRTAARR